MWGAYWAEHGYVALLVDSFGPRGRAFGYGRGTHDDWYTEAREAADLVELARIDARVETCVFEGGHEWTDSFRDAAAGFLHRLRSRGHDAD